MILGFFDSWLGGQVVLSEFQKVFPDIEMILEMDRTNAPYWSKTTEEIQSLTKQGIDRLYARGADVIIIACNTAHVHALRWIQQEVYPDRHILWVTVPGAEAVVEGGYKKIWVLATDATVRIRAYKERVHILDDSIHIEEVAAPELVPLIESWILSGPEIANSLWKYLSQFSPDIEALVLGCTHYPLIQDEILRVWSDLNHEKTPAIIDPGVEAVRKFREWMERKKR
jgi:glutamate racemase